MNIGRGLNQITQLLLASKTEKEEIIAVKMLSSFYEEILEKISSEELNKIGLEVKGGVALSPMHAKDCLYDYIRTARFIKGVYKAINSAKESFFDKNLEIVYAGCGPLATLIIPLLSCYDSKKISITLIDIHEVSIMSAKKIIEYLSYEEYIKEYCITDATKYTHNKKKSLHVVITETMDKALINEPQVSITQNLVAQLSEGGVLVPEEIKLSTRNSFFAKENFFGKSVANEEYINDTALQDLFSITKNIKKTKDEFSFESGYIRFDKDFEKTPDICIYTEIRVFDDVYINKGESLITNPYCVKSLYSVSSNPYRLFYTTKKRPKWDIKNTQ
ncbi:hypothetical protein CXF68_19735 [Tenacibaculum sp. Bg11-29]|uniref:hypothetical protein n=1 Tax=Tenacibaculum sp. Bg11-29 TaxID=2058306 RepID=UPI000C32CB1B|nr:hypothetical protein [Tenacibaculum sp. Bg11-29]PKH52789.1 hypothetical protein CXF68_19735 [Tenacibaculum sp. Bg11-29]